MRTGRSTRGSKSAFKRGIVGAAATMLFFAACSPEAEPEPGGTPEDTASAAPSGPWSFIDDLGVETSLDEAPQRIIAYETAAASLWSYGIQDQIVGVLGFSPMETNTYLEGMDLSGIESVGEVYGEPELEKMAALDPDLIVLTSYLDYRTGADPKQISGLVNAEQRRAAAAIAPIVAINEYQPATPYIDRMGELAESLGADLDAPELVQARERFETAQQELRAALADNPDISVMGVSGLADSIYIAQPVDFPDLPEFQRLGMNVVVPDSEDQYFQQLSWEEVDTYPADIIMVDARPSSPPIEEYDSFSPTWTSLPAVEADQLFAWQMYVSTTDYDRYAEQMELMADAVENAEDVA